MLGPETTAYLVAALNPPGVCARGLSGVLLKAVQSSSPIPLFVAQRSEEIIKGEPVPHLLVPPARSASLRHAHACRGPRGAVLLGLWPDVAAMLGLF